jgi:predicted outer membrane repeat protein
VLYHSTLSSNSAIYGGGADGSTLYNCVLNGNSVHADPVARIPGNGGGANGSTLYNCALSGNSASGVSYPAGSFPGEGGGGSYCTLYNCTVSGNSSTDNGGGIWAGTLYNCIVYFNSSPGGNNHDTYGYTRLTHCCTLPQPTNGAGNIALDPLLTGLRLQSNSPCINAGNNAYVTTATDLEGNPRIVSGTVDIGAYEYQGTGSRISYAWLQQYGLPTDGSVDFIDSDHDAMNNWQEWICGTDPTNPPSVLRMVSAMPTPTKVMVTWQSVAGVNYFLLCSTNLSASPCFRYVATNIIGQAGTTTYTDTSTTGAGPFVYRVGVNSP